MHSFQSRLSWWHTKWKNIRDKTPEEWRIRGAQMRVAGRGGDESPHWCVQRKGGEHKKQMADEREETGHGYGTHKDRFGLSASKGYKNTYGTESTHCHASSVEANSQNIGTATALRTGQLQPHTQSAATCAAALCSSISRVCSHTQRQGRRTLMWTVAIQTPTRADK